ncbi:MAG: hypothetical protein LBG10_07670, partial [Treponema sp.]|nr:hypothetical protein [Treponema sp.]
MAENRSYPDKWGIETFLRRFTRQARRRLVDRKIAGRDFSKKDGPEARDRMSSAGGRFPLLAKNKIYPKMPG